MLEAAEAVFAAEGIDVPIDVIAERAGVGVGTLYRHFPTKEKLFEAILVERVTELAADARSRLETRIRGTAFFSFLDVPGRRGLRASETSSTRSPRQASSSKSSPQRRSARSRRR